MSRAASAGAPWHAPPMRRALAVIGVLVLGAWEPFRMLDPDVEAGNRAYAEGRYGDAITAYDRAAERGGVDRAGLAFDRATAELKQAEAIKDPAEKQRLTDHALEDLKRAGQSRDPRVRGGASYNRGNALMQRDKLEDAIEAYKQALREQPDLDDARVNLELALRRRQKQQPPQQPQGQQGQGQGQGQQGQGQGGQGQGQQGQPGQGQPGQGPPGQGQPGQGQPGQGQPGAQGQGPQGQGQPPDQRGSNGQGSDPQRGSNGQGSDPQSGSNGQGSNQQNGSNGQGSNQQNGSNGQGSNQPGPQNGSNGQGSNQQNDASGQGSNQQNRPNGPPGRSQRGRTTGQSPRTPIDGKLDDLDNYSRRLQKEEARRRATGRSSDPQHDW